MLAWQWWWLTPLVPALRRQRQVDLWEFEASLVYKANSKTARTVSQRKPCLKETNKTNKPTKNLKCRVIQRISCLSLLVCILGIIKKFGFLFLFHLLF